MGLGRTTASAPRKLRHILLLLALLAAAPFFFLGGPDWTSSPFYRAFWNLGHIAFFAIAVALLVGHCGAGGWRRWLGISVTVLLVSIAIEALQSQLGDRQSNWGDVLRNLIGAWLALFWLQGGGALVWGGRLLAAVLLVQQCVVVAQVGWLQVRIAHQLPILSNLESPGEAERWTGQVERTRAWQSEGAYGLRVMLEPRPYSGTFLTAMPRDWRGYRQLHFDIFNPGPIPLRLTLRISDLQHDRGANAYNDRFNTSLWIQPGWNRHTIDLATVKAAPAQREMDMAHIRSLGLFTSRLDRERVLFLDNVRLR